MTPKEIWKDKCEAARGVKENFGTENALTYLIGEKFLDFLDVAERDKDYHAELPAFAAEIKDMFEQHEIADYLERHAIVSHSNRPTTTTRTTWTRGHRTSWTLPRP
jgi:hypothetical protein